MVCVCVCVCMCVEHCDSVGVNERVWQNMRVLGAHKCVPGGCGDAVRTWMDCVCVCVCVCDGWVIGNGLM